LNGADAVTGDRRPGAGRDPSSSAPAIGPRPSPGRPGPLPAAQAVGFRTLLVKEVLRFWKVSFQTVAAPVLTGVLYLLVFGHVLEDRVEVFPGVGYTAFLIPGLVAMSMLQNAFANSSSSLIQSKITGNLVFVLLPPISNREFFLAYVSAAVVRGLVVGLGVFAVTVWFAPPPLRAPLWIAVFAVAGSALLGVLGLIAGIVSDKFDQLAAFQNFVIMPATFLSGVFYSVHGLPPFWQAVSHLNPFFYLIDGFRYGFFAVSDASPWLSLAIVLAALAAASAVALSMLARGYKIRT
jgi:ABC-2 type transport system permease protein